MIYVKQHKCQLINIHESYWLISKGGVHICKLAYGDLTWENSSNPDLYVLWYINSRPSMEYFMWAISGSDLGQILPHIWTPPYQFFHFFGSESRYQWQMVIQCTDVTLKLCKENKCQINNLFSNDVTMYHFQLPDQREEYWFKLKLLALCQQGFNPDSLAYNWLSSYSMVLIGA